VAEYAGGDDCSFVVVWFVSLLDGIVVHPRLMSLESVIMFDGVGRLFECLSADGYAYVLAIESRNVRERIPKLEAARFMNIGSVLAMTLHLREKAADTSV